MCTVKEEVPPTPRDTLPFSVILERGRVWLMKRMRMGDESLEVMKTESLREGAI